MNDDLDAGKTKDQLIEELKEHLDIETAGRKGDLERTRDLLSALQSEWD